MQPTCDVCGETIFDGWDFCPACQHPYDGDDTDEDTDEDEDDDLDDDEGEFFDDVGWGP